MIDYMFADKTKSPHSGAKYILYYVPEPRSYSSMMCVSLFGSFLCSTKERVQHATSVLPTYDSPTYGVHRLSRAMLTLAFLVDLTLTLDLKMLCSFSGAL